MVWQWAGQTPNNERFVMKALSTVTGILVLVGAANWGLVAVAEFDLVAALFADGFGTTSPLSRIVYGLVGLSALHQAVVVASGRGVALRRTAEVHA